MRRLAFGLGLFTPFACALSACAPPSPDRSYPVFFNDFSSTLDPAGTAVVNNAATVANRYPSAPVKVSGYADAFGSPDAAVKLSKARADAVATLLAQDGVAPARVTRAAVGTPPNTQPGVERRRVEIDLDLP